MLAHRDEPIVLGIADLVPLGHLRLSCLCVWGEGEVDEHCGRARDHGDTPTVLGFFRL
jgi:hypothetical protein